MNYKIAEKNRSAFLNKMTRLNSKLARVDVAPVIPKLVDQTDEVDANNANLRVRYFNYEVEAPAPIKANGWEFVATLVHTNDGNIIRSLPGFNVPTEFRDKPTYCAHCQTNRQRRDTYVVRHTDGRCMQVGSSCLQEFIGAPANRLARASELLLNVYDVCESATKDNWLGGTAISTFRIDLDTFLANVAAVVIASGEYITRKMVMDRNSSQQTTAERGYQNMASQALPVTPEAEKLAADARSYVFRKLSPSVTDIDNLGDDEVAAMALNTLTGINHTLTDFEHNILSCARAEAIEPRLIGTAGYIIEMFRRSQRVAVKANVGADLSPEGLVRVFRMFGTAKLHLKRPAIRLANAQGSRLHLSLAGENSKNAGCIYVKEDGTGGTYYGKIDYTGRFSPTRECPDSIGTQLLEFAKDPEMVASQYGKLTGCCCFCSRKLTDQRSTEVGYGPICASKFGLNWGSVETAPEAPVAMAVAS